MRTAWLSVIGIDEGCTKHWCTRMVAGSPHDDGAAAPAGWDDIARRSDIAELRGEMLQKFGVIDGRFL